MARAWFLLFISYIVAHTIFFLLVWRNLDLGFNVMTQYAALPFLQALAISWLCGVFSINGLVQAAKRLFRSPMISVLWAGELMLLFVYWGDIFETDLTEVVVRTAGIVTLLAAVLMLIRMRPIGRPRKWPAFLSFLFLLFLLGSNSLSPWFMYLPLLLPSGWPLLLNQLIVLSVLLALLILLTETGKGIIGERSPLAGAVLSWVPPLFIAAALSLVVNESLYAFLVSPFKEMIATFLSLAANCLITAALCSVETEPESSRADQSISAELGPVNLWFVLTLSTVSGALLLRIFFLRHWLWDIKTVLGFLLIPLLQAFWFKWVYELTVHWRSVFKILSERPFLTVFLYMEIFLIGYCTFWKNLWESRLFLLFVSVLMAFKLLFLGALTIRMGMRKVHGKIFQWACGLGALLTGARILFEVKVPVASWLMAAFGANFLLAAYLWRSKGSHAARFIIIAAGAGVVPVFSMAICTILTQADPMIWVLPPAYFLVLISTTIMIFGWHNPLNHSH